MVATVVFWAVAASVATMAGVVLFRMLSGGIRLDGLLRVEPHAPFGFDRLQLVAVTLLFAAGYIVAALGKGPNDALPGIPTPLLLILIGSNGTYLAAKFAALRSGSNRGS